MWFSSSFLSFIKTTVVSILVAAFLVSQAQAGKGWGKGGKKANQGSTPVVSNTAPTISGVPGSSVTQDTSYSFRPGASDADGDELNFSIRNRPIWASFNSSTGQLSGTPANQHVGTYGDITISVSDGSDSTALPPFSIEVVDANDAPSISGSPPADVVAGDLFSFKPSASDPDGDSLSFRIRNRPAWASFDAGTGKLSGTPGAGDVGSYSDIQIDVSDGAATVGLAPFSVTVNSAGDQTGSVSLSWTAPTARADGTPLQPSELAGYTVHYGQAQGNYDHTIGVDDPFKTSITITDLPTATYHFVLTARDSTGQVSSYSGSVSRQAR
jgi:hypothetical protein